MTIMTNHELCGRLLYIANDLKTLYVMGGIGYPLDARGKRRAVQNAYNAKADRKKMIYDATDDTFAFDCVCLVKAVLWGFDGNITATYGGARYASNGVPDTTIEQLYAMGSKHSTDMTDIAEGEFLVLHEHHCGVYVGNGMVVESTPNWKNGVQVTQMYQRPWKKHCYLPHIKYEVAVNADNSVSNYPYPDKTDIELAYMTIAGKLGNGETRKEHLKDRYRAVQDVVNNILGAGRR